MLLLNYARKEIPDPLTDFTIGAYAMGGRYLA
jgi:hypothetical protein